MNKATFKNFEIKASYKGTKKEECSSNNFNNHMITVENTETNQKICFEFWASLESPELQTEHEILKAFCLFVGDACFFKESEKYQKNVTDKKTEKIYKKCKKQFEKLSKIYNDDIYTLYNELSAIK